MYELHFKVKVYQHINQAQSGQAEQRKSEQHGQARTFNPARSLVPNTVNGSNHPVNREQKGNDERTVSKICNH
jgi:hypothetical protein